MLVCFDTMLLIWGVRGTSNDEQEGMVTRTKRYISHLSEQDHRILLPTPVIAEYLIPLPDEETRLLQLQELQKLFRIAPFDLHAAKVTADIISKAKSDEEIQSYYEGRRIPLKFDCQIIAVAITGCADLIVSHDAGLRKLAQGHIETKDLPEFEEQLTLFE